mgnify:CR=1 FL=1
MNRHAGGCEVLKRSRIQWRCTCCSAHTPPAAACPSARGKLSLQHSGPLPCSAHLPKPPLERLDHALQPAAVAGGGSSVVRGLGVEQVQRITQLLTWAKGEDGIAGKVHGGGGWGRAAAHVAMHHCQRICRAVARGSERWGQRSPWPAGPSSPAPAPAHPPPPAAACCAAASWQPPPVRYAAPAAGSRPRQPSPAAKKTRCRRIER